MTSFKVEWKKSAVKELRSFDKPVIQKIIAAVDKLSENPFEEGVKKLVGSNQTYRKRVGDYRIIFEIVFNRLIIEIIKVGHRKDIYR